MAYISTITVKPIGTKLILYNNNTETLELKHGSGNLIIPTKSTGSILEVQTNEFVVLVSVGSSWVVGEGNTIYRLLEEVLSTINTDIKGSWTEYIASAAKFSASTGTWTVDVANRNIRYKIIGKTVHLSIYVSTSATSGAGSTLEIELTGSIAGFSNDEQIAGVAKLWHIGTGTGFTAYCWVNGNTLYIRSPEASFGTIANLQLFAQLTYELP